MGTSGPSGKRSTPASGSPSCSNRFDAYTDSAALQVICARRDPGVCRRLVVDSAGAADRARSGGRPLVGAVDTPGRGFTHRGVRRIPAASFFEALVADNLHIGCPELIELIIRCGQRRGRPATGMSRPRSSPPASRNTRMVPRSRPRHRRRPSPRSYQPALAPQLPHRPRPARRGRTWATRTCAWSSNSTSSTTVFSTPNTAHHKLAFRTPCGMPAYGAIRNPRVCQKSHTGRPSSQVKTASDSAALHCVESSTESFLPVHVSTMWCSV